MTQSICWIIDTVLFTVQVIC